MSSGSIDMHGDVDRQSVMAYRAALSLKAATGFKNPASADASG
jgi:hypothetical protein